MLQRALRWRQKLQAVLCLPRRFWLLLGGGWLPAALPSPSQSSSKLLVLVPLPGICRDPCASLLPFCRFLV